MLVAKLAHSSLRFPCYKAYLNRIVHFCLWCLFWMLDGLSQTDIKQCNLKCHVLEKYWIHLNIFKSILLTLSLWVLLALTLWPTLSPIYSLLYFHFLKSKALLRLTHHLSLSGDQTTSLCDFISSMKCKRRIRLVVFRAVRSQGDWGFQAF